MKLCEELKLFKDIFGEISEYKLIQKKKTWPAGCRCGAMENLQRMIKE